MPPSQPQTRCTLGITLKDTHVIGGAAVGCGLGVDVGDEIVAVDGQPVAGCQNTLVQLICANDQEGERAVITVLKKAHGARRFQDVVCTRTRRSADPAPAVEHELPAPPAPAEATHSSSLLPPALAGPPVMASPPKPEEMKIVAIANIPTNLPLDHLQSMIAFANFEDPYDLGVGYYAAQDASTCKLYFHLESPATARRLLSDLNVNFWGDIAANFAHPGACNPGCSSPCQPSNARRLTPHDPRRAHFD